MPSLIEQTSAMARIIANRAANSGAAVIGGTAAAFTTSVAVAYTIDGRYLSLGAQTNTALSALAAADLPASQSSWVQPSGASGFVTQPANTTNYYVLCVNAAGAVRVVQGTWVGQLIVTNGVESRGNGDVPQIPDGVAPFALLRVVSGGSTFLAGTTALTGVGTFQNIEYLPTNPRP